MCYEIGHPLHPAGKRCAVNAPSVRRLSRRAAYFYGIGDAEARKKLTALPIEMQEGNTGDRARLAASTTDRDVIELGMKDRPAVRKALASNPALSESEAQQVLASLSTVKQKTAKAAISSIDDVDKHPELLKGFKTSDPELARALLSHSNPLAQIAGCRSATIEVSIQWQLHEIVKRHPEYLDEVATEGLITPLLMEPADVDRLFDQLPPNRQEQAIKRVDSPRMLSLRSKGEDIWGRREAAENPLTPLADLRRLSASEDDPTQRLAKATLARLARRKAPSA